MLSMCIAAKIAAHHETSDIKLCEEVYVSSACQNVCKAVVLPGWTETTCAFWLDAFLDAPESLNLQSGNCGIGLIQISAHT